MKRSKQQFLPAALFIGSALLLTSYKIIKCRLKRAKEHKKALEENNLRLVRAQKELEDFTACATHELQAPLRKIQSYAGMIQEQTTDTQPAIKGYLSRIVDIAQGMHKLLFSLLELAKISKTPFSPETYDLNEIVVKALDELNVEIQDVRAEVVIAEPLPTIYADAYFLHQLFMNLISNSLKYKKETIAPRVLIYAENINGFVRILIQDNGIGIPAEYLDKIFIPFFKLGKGNEHPGIGLALCKKIVQRHKGHISAVSSEGLGTIIMIDLPIVEEL